MATTQIVLPAPRAGQDRKPYFEHDDARGHHGVVISRLWALMPPGLSGRRPAAAACIRPSCMSMPSWSGTPQCSTIFPFSKRATSMTSISNDLPAGGKPMTEPVFTPRARLSDQTVSPSAASLTMVSSTEAAAMEARCLGSGPPAELLPIGGERIVPDQALRRNTNFLRWAGERAAPRRPEVMATYLASIWSATVAIEYRL